MSSEIKRGRGFASMDKEKHREVASAAGKVAHACGRAHKFTSEEARAAGKKGGLRISQNKEWMSEIGRRGGKARAKGKTSREEGSVERVGDTSGIGSDPCDSL